MADERGEAPRPEGAGRAASWFDTARLGLFIHWGHASRRGWELSWPLVGGSPVPGGIPDVPVATYHESARGFDPEPDSARTWLGLAREAGMRYAVFTAKHHDGFAMFHTRHSDFSVEHSACGRDLVAEYVRAAREAGLRVGLYFSLSDWHHPDYPAFTDADKPYVLGAYPKPDPERWPHFLALLFGQVRELLTGYGPIDLLWLDGGWERSAEQWRAPELCALIRSLQPGILLNDRLPGAGDFSTPEQFVPAEPPAGRWETCLTMNETWGYNPDDRAYKSARDLVHTLCEVAGRGGNLLLNVSPMADGKLPAEQVERLHEIGTWMARNGGGILDTGAGLEPWQFYGPTTRRGNRIFLHLLSRPYDAVTVRGVRVERVRAVRDVASGRALVWSARVAIADRLFDPDPTGELRIAVPEQLVDPLATTLELELDTA